MPTERMEEVEVVCGACNSTGIWTVITGVYIEIPATGDPGAGPRKFTTADQPCNTCGGSLTQRLPVAPGSLTAARLRLADAAERMDKASKASTECHTVFGTEEECAAFYAKVGYTEAEALAVEQECYAACAEYNAALAALRTARGA